MEILIQKYKIHFVYKTRMNKPKKAKKHWMTNNILKEITKKE